MDDPEPQSSVRKFNGDDEPVSEREGLAAGVFQQDRAFFNQVIAQLSFRAFALKALPALCQAGLFSEGSVCFPVLEREPGAGRILYYFPESVDADGLHDSNLPDHFRPGKDRKSIPIFDFRKMLTAKRVRSIRAEKRLFFFHPWQAQGRTLSDFGNYRGIKNRDILKGGGYSGRGCGVGGLRANASIGSSM